jgi:hypothetical protein
MRFSRFHYRTVRVGQPRAGRNARGRRADAAARFQEADMLLTVYARNRQPRPQLIVMDDTGPAMQADEEITWHREQIARNRDLIAELEAGNSAGSEVFPETQAEVDRLKAQIEQSELIVAAYEKEHPQG